MSRKKLPAIMFYPGDWMKDPAIRSCSLAARGLWFDMLCLMHESHERGKLVHRTGIPVSPSQLARMVGADLVEAESLLEELEATGVFSRREDDGAIICRRMVADEAEREVKSAAGRKGAANRWNGGTQEAEPMADGWQSDGKGDAKGMAPLESESEGVVAYPTFEFKREIAIVMEAIPPKRRRRYNKLGQSIASAMLRLEGKGHDREGAVAFLKDRLTAYCQSGEGKGEYHRMVVTWLDEDGFLEPEEAWEGRHADKSGTGWEAIDAEEK